MKCNYCGYESESEFKFCPTCGANCQVEPPKDEPEFVSQTENQNEFQDEPQFDSQPAPDYVSVNLAKEKILPALKDKLYLAICILLTVSSGLAILNGTLPVLNILFAVFSWMVYSAAKKDVVDTEKLRCISGTAYANYIIFNVFAGIFIACGLLIGVAFSAYSGYMSFSELLAEGIFEVEGLPPDTIDLLDSIDASEILGWILGGVFVFAGIVMLVINLLCYRKIHKFAKSVYVSVENHNPDMIECANTVKIWLWVFGICNVFVALGNISNILLSACNVATPIIAAILIKKYILTNREFDLQ